MKQLILFWFCFFLLVSLVSAENLCSFQERNNFWFNSPFDKLVMPKPDFEKPKTFFLVEQEEVIVPKKILITEKGFEPKEIKVKANYPVVWKNERKQTGSLVYGVREISGMKSGMISFGENFTWRFSEPGVYTYVDAVVLGRVGRIVVQ